MSWTEAQAQLAAYPGMYVGRAAWGPNVLVTGNPSRVLLARAANGVLITGPAGYSPIAADAAATDWRVWG